MEFDKIYEDLDTMLVPGLSLLFFLLLILSYRACMHYKNALMRSKQLEQRMSDIVSDLRMNIKYQSDKLHEMISLQSEAEQMIECFFDLCTDMLCMLDVNGRFSKINPSWTKILGYAEEELLYKPFVGLVHPDDRNDATIQFENMLSGKATITFDNRCVCKDGSHKWISWSLMFIPEQNIFCAMAIDLTERKNIAQLARSLNEAQEYDKLKTEFFTNVSHELKTPLSVLISTMQLYKLNLDSHYPETNNGMHKYFHIMKQNCYRLLRLVNNLTNLTRIDSGFFSLQLGNHNIVSIVEDVFLSVAEYIKNKNIEFVLDTEIEERIIACDLDKIESIILNILSNAVKFTDHGGRIEVSIRDGGENIIISIKDTGVGIPEDKLDLIFERFKQLDKTYSRNYGGTGIGLALVKSMVEMHNGKVQAKNNPTNGAEFIVQLPAYMISQDAVLQRTKNGCIQQSRTEKVHVEFSDTYLH